VLEQQLSQMQVQLGEAEKRENKQKCMYERILRLINEQLESDVFNHMDSSSFLIKLNNVQNIIS